MTAYLDNAPKHPSSPWHEDQEGSGQLNNVVDKCAHMLEPGREHVEIPTQWIWNGLSLW